MNFKKLFVSPSQKFFEVVVSYLYIVLDLADPSTTQQHYHRQWPVCLAAKIECEKRLGAICALSDISTFSNPTLLLSSPLMTLPCSYRLLNTQHPKYCSEGIWWSKFFTLKKFTLCAIIFATKEDWFGDHNVTVPL